MKQTIILLIALMLSSCTQNEWEEPVMSVEVRSQLGDVLLSGNPIWVDVYGAEPDDVSQYEILLRIVSADDALVGSPMIDAISPDDDNMAYFNIQGRVNQPVDYDFEYPLTNKVNSYDLLAFDITIEAGERYIDSDGEKQTVWSEVTSSHRILKGGLSRLIQETYAPGDFYDYFIAEGKFLTWQYNGSYASPEQPLKLWYIHPGSDGDVWTLKVTVSYDGEDGFTGEGEESITFDTSCLYEFNLALDLWGIDASSLTHGDVTKIVVGLYNAADELQTEQFVWYFDTDYYEENTYIYFKNSIAGIDCLWCTGSVVEELTTETETASRPDISTINIKRATQVVSSITGQRKWTVNTGDKEKDELTAMRDFVLSDNIWLVKNDNAIPVILQNKDKVMQQLSRNIDNIELEFLEAHIESNY